MVRSILFVTLVLAAQLASAAPRSLVAVGDTGPLGLPLSHFSEVALDDGGQVGFVAGSSALFRRSPGGIARVAGAGDRLAGRTLAGVGAADSTSAGCLAFSAVFVGGGSGVLRQCGAGTEMVAEAGDPAPDGTACAAFGSEVRIGATGRVAFTSTLANGLAAVLFTDGGGFAEVARVGGASPAGGTFTAFRLVGVDAAGRVGFRASVAGGRNGLFFGDGTALAKLVVEGDASPAGGSFGVVGFAALNDAGQWAFRATRSLDGAGGVFRADASAVVPLITTVVLQGDASPIGGVFAAFPTSLVPPINSTGAIAFRAGLEGAGFTAGVFVAAPGGGLRRIVVVGEPTGAGQLFRLRETALGDDGTVLVRATLAGGRPGLFRGAGGGVEPFALLGEATDLGDGVRFSEPSARGAAAVFLGVRDGLFVVDQTGGVRALAVLRQPTPLGGTYAAFDPPAAGRGGRIVFGADIDGGRAGEALLAVGRRRLKVVARTGRKVRAGRIQDLFADPIDDLARAGVGPGGVAFQTALAGGSASTGLLLRSGGRLRPVALSGRPAPRGGSFRAFGTPAVLDARRVAFVAEVGGTREQNLVLRAGTVRRTLASAGADTLTRLGGVFRTFDTPAAASGGVVFRATLDQGSREGLFFSPGRRMLALVGSGDAAPGGGRFRRFAVPVGAAARLVFRADLTAAAAPNGLFHLPLPARLDDVVPPAAALAVVGQPSPLGGTFLGFGAPSGNRGGVVAYTAAIAGGSSSAAIVVDTLD